MQQQIEQSHQEAHDKAHKRAIRQTPCNRKLALTAGLLGFALVGSALCGTRLTQAVAQTVKATAPEEGSTPLGHALNLTKDGRIVTDDGKLIVQIPSASEVGATKGNPKVLSFKVVDGKVVKDDKVIFAPMGKAIVIGKDGKVSGNTKFQVFKSEGIIPLDKVKGNVRVFVFRRAEVAETSKKAEVTQSAPTEKKAEKVAPATKKPSAPMA